MGGRNSSSAGGGLSSSSSSNNKGSEQCTGAGAPGPNQYCYTAGRQSSTGDPVGDSVAAALCTRSEATRRCYGQGVVDGLDSSVAKYLGISAGDSSDSSDSSHTSDLSHSSHSSSSSSRKGWSNSTPLSSSKFASWVDSKLRSLGESGSRHGVAYSVFSATAQHLLGTKVTTNLIGPIVIFGTSGRGRPLVYYNVGEVRDWHSLPNHHEKYGHRFEAYTLHPDGRYLREIAYDHLHDHSLGHY